ncbi:MAG: deaminase [Candidatus Thorarchaeota archaeon]|jgi:dCMP deaminase
MKRPSRDEVNMTLVYLIASRSKDERTHTGAVIIGPDNEIRSTGYNGFVRGLNDNVAKRQKKPEKYFWFEHAERNAIYNATLNGVSLKDCLMYTNGIPCMDCARGIVQSGIKEVIVDKKWNEINTRKWKKHAKRSLEMFAEVGVKIRYYEGGLLDVVRFRGGKVVQE